MYHIVYLSTAARTITDADLTDILTTSRKKNLQRNVTGVLLYCDGNFVQLLEGHEEDVRAIYADIEKDDRHKNLILLISAPAEKRSFPDWTMGFASTDKNLLKDLEGYLDPTHPEFLKADHNTQALFILQTFAENNKISGC